MPISRFLSIYRNVLSTIKVFEDDSLKAFFLSGDDAPCLFGLRTEVGENGRNCGDEFVAGGCEAEFPGKGVIGVEVVP